MFHTGLHENYHRPRDDAETLNYEGMLQVSQLVLNVVYEATDADERPTFRPAAREESEDTERSYVAALPESPPRLGILWDPQDEKEGILVTRVLGGTPSHLAGVRRGDRLMSLAGEPLDDAERFRQLVLLAHGEVPVVVERQGEDEPITLTLSMPARPVRWGIAWRENDGEPGVITVVQVTAGTAAEPCGLAVGDRIYEVNGLPFENSAAFTELTRRLTGPVELLIERHGRLEPVVIQLPPLVEDVQDVAAASEA
jgi:C-terminal processing protease CtpA/Prc